MDLSRVFKAYDVRGVVPDELDAELVRRVGSAFVAWSGASEILIGRDSRLLVTGARRGAHGRRHRTRGGRDRPRARLHRPPVLRVRIARPARRDDHRESQPQGVQRAEVLPGRRETGGRGLRAPGDRALVETGTPPVGTVAGPFAAATSWTPTSTTSCRSPTRRDASAHRRGRHRERHGGTRRARGRRTAADHAAPPLRRARRHVPQPSGRPDRPREPARPEARGPGAGGGPRHGLRRRRGPRVPGGRARGGRERVPAHRARRGRDARPAPGRRRSSTT